MGVRQRRVQAHYLNVGASTEDYVLCGAGFTDLNESPAAKTSSKRYVNDKSESKAIIGYDWSVPFTTDQIREEKAVDFICNIGEMQLVGDEAETTYVIVDLDKKVGETGTAYKARKFKVAVEISDFGDEDGEMTASGNFLGVGDLVAGTFDASTKAFTATGV